MPNAYDGQAFVLHATNDAEPGLFYLSPTDLSLPPAPVRGSFHGRRYDLDPKESGKMEDYVPGPFVGAEMLELRAKLGGATAGVDNWPSSVPVATHDDGTPWTSAECAAFRGPVNGGPNAAADIDNAKTLEELAKEAEAKSGGSAATPAPAPSAPTPAPTPIPPAGPPLAASSTNVVAQHADSLFKRVEEELAKVGHAAGSEAHYLYLEARDAFAALLHHL
jgi:hypothetical protein